MGFALYMKDHKLDIESVGVYGRDVAQNSKGHFTARLTDYSKDEHPWMRGVGDYSVHEASVDVDSDDDSVSGLPNLTGGVWRGVGRSTASGGFVRV